MEPLSVELSGNLSNRAGCWRLLEPGGFTVRRATNGRRSSITELSFHGICTLRKKTESVTSTTAPASSIASRPPSSTLLVPLNDRANIRIGRAHAHHYCKRDNAICCEPSLDKKFGAPLLPPALIWDCGLSQPAAPGARAAYVARDNRGASACSAVQPVPVRPSAVGNVAEA